MVVENSLVHYLLVMYYFVFVGDDAPDKLGFLGDLSQFVCLVKECFNISVVEGGLQLQ